jgi:hypothetical protein
MGAPELPERLDPRGTVKMNERAIVAATQNNRIPLQPIDRNPFREEVCSLCVILLVKEKVGEWHYRQLDISNDEADRAFFVLGRELFGQFGRELHHLSFVLFPGPVPFGGTT